MYLLINFDFIEKKNDYKPDIVWIFIFELVFISFFYLSSSLNFGKKTG